MLSIEISGNKRDYYDIDDPFFIDLFPKIKAHTITAMVGAEPTWALYKSIEYIVNNKIPGDIVECGVWNGGSMLLAAMALIYAIIVGNMAGEYTSRSGPVSLWLAGAAFAPHSTASVIRLRSEGTLDAQVGPVTASATSRSPGRHSGFKPAATPVTMASDGASCVVNSRRI